MLKSAKRIACRNDKRNWIGTAEFDAALHWHSEPERIGPAIAGFMAKPLPSPKRLPGEHAQDRLFRLCQMDIDIQWNATMLICLANRLYKKTSDIPEEITARYDAGIAVSDKVRAEIGAIRATTALGFRAKSKVITSLVEDGDLDFDNTVEPILISLLRDCAMFDTFPTYATDGNSNVAKLTRLAEALRNELRKARSLVRDALDAGEDRATVAARLNETVSTVNCWAGRRKFDADGRVVRPQRAAGAKGGIAKAVKSNGHLAV